MTFVPEDFGVPAVLEADRFRLRPITIHDLLKDHAAVMASRERLWELFGGVWGWPSPDLTLGQDLLDLARHERGFRRRSSFCYAVVSPDERRLLGRVHVDPSEMSGYDAEVRFWVRSGEPETEGIVEEAVRGWIADAWPFGRVAYPGRTAPRRGRNLMPDRRVA